MKNYDNFIPVVFLGEENKMMMLAQFNKSWIKKFTEDHNSELRKKEI